MQTSKTNKKINLKLSLCSVCLSADRKLNKLLEYRDIFKQICKNVVKGMNIEIFLCFECLALLRNVKKFQEKVQISQNILKSYKKTDVEKKPFENLSNLSTTEADVFDSNKPVANEALDDIKRDIVSEIKVENEDYSDCDTFDYEPLSETKCFIKETLPEIYIKGTPNEIVLIKNKEDVKDEILECMKDKPKTPEIETVFKTDETENPELQNYSSSDCEISGKKVIKKQIRKSRRMYLNKDRSELYKILTPDTSKANVYQRLEIPYEEIKYWLEKERNSIFFKKTRSKCEKCAMGVVQRKLQKHANRHLKYSDNVHYTCDYCTLSFRSKSLLKTHFNIHRFIRCCTACGYKCINKHHMYKHVRKEHIPRRAVQCLQCQTIVRTTKKFYMHYRKEHYVESRGFICDYCNKRCGTKRTIEKHIFNRHTLHPCTKCDQVFRYPQGLKDHYSLKHVIERSEACYCVKCDRQFDNLAQFKNHIASAVAHKDEWKSVPQKKTFQCPACPKIYAKGCSMQNHYDKYHAEKGKYVCPKCDKKLLTNSKLKEHIKYNHEGYERERKHICTVCERGFTQKPVLTKHMRTHTGERPYECSQCDSKFAQRTAMLTHIKNIHMKSERKLQTGEFSNFQMGLS